MLLLLAGSWLPPSMLHGLDSSTPSQLQQLLFCVAMLLPSPGLMVLAGLFMAGSRAMRFLICIRAEGSKGCRGKL